MGQYVFGLDIGIASVGWAVLDEARIVDLGVRCFDKAETAKEGDPLNLARRQARLLRRRLYRRAWRLTQLARLLKREDLVPNAKLFAQSPAFTEPDTTDPKDQRQQTTSAWELRRQGLDRLLTPLEWARVIYHLCKHRGFHWISKAEEAAADSDAEGGRVKQGLKSTKTLMEAKGYRSAAEMVLAEFPTAQRNKQGQYDKALSRVLLGQELALLFATQRRLGHAHASERFEALILGNGDKKSGLFWQQKPSAKRAWARNLADDLIEPYRPIVDLHVAQQTSRLNDTELQPAEKLALISLLNVDVDMPRGQMSVLASIEQAAESLARLYDGGGEQALELPGLIKLRQHQFEM